MADCLPSPVKEIGKCIWDCFLKSHFDYWWCFEDNFQQLNEGIVKLKQKIEGITSDWRLTRIRPAKLEKWLNDSTKKIEEALSIMPDGNIPGNIPNWHIRSRYSLGKNAKETAKEITKLLNQGDLIQIEHPAPSPAMASPPHRSTTNFESRKGIEEDIIKFLKESRVDVIGICGMGGVGKTTMARRIWTRVKDENLFDEVVMVTVSQKIDVPKIQNEIADLLKLEFKESSMSARAHQLRTRLMDPKRKIIILDDLWKSLKLDDLGVPFESERCKILLTTRFRDVFKQMEVQKIITMKILTEQEAWILFKDKTGDCVEDSTLESMPKDVVAECKGLPLALVAVGVALRDNTNIRKWRDSLSQLKKSNPTDFLAVLKDVYNPLKLSYDCLDNNREQHLFLLCCLFPEDYHIPVERLSWYSMGLGLFDDFDDIQNIEEARNRTHTLVEKLESRFLLIDVEEDGMKGLEVKMHDVTRDVAIYIGSKEKNGFLKSLTSIKNSSDVNCNWMSVDISNEQMEVPLLSRFPKLELLMWTSKGFYDISQLSFEGMEDLKVLSFEDISIGSLPPTLGSLKNLQTLRLVKCEVENISVIGKLTSLKILSCCRCANITELPAEIGSLSGLRLLELSRCDLLQTIPFGVISSLHRLEELKMRGSFSRWEAEEKGKERRNASLKELEWLRNLSCLEIEIDDCTLSAQEIHLSPNLVKYYVRIGSYDYYYFKETDYKKVMILSLPSDIGAVGKWIQKGVRNTELLHLEGDGSNNFNIAEIENLRNLRVKKCSTVKKLDMVFCSLDTLILDELENLEEICQRTIHNIKSIEIRSCPKLRSLFLVSGARTSSLQLEVLEIKHCESLEVMFWNEGTVCIELPKLQELNLEYLPKLNSLSFLKDDSCCNLKTINIWKCNKLRSLFSVSADRRFLLQLEVLKIRFCESMEEVFWNEGTDDNTDGCIEFPKLKDLTPWNLPKLNSLSFLKDDSCCNLKTIDIWQCDKLRSLCSVSVARSCLLQLEVLEIRFCESMEQVFWNEGTDDNTTDGCIEFPKLKELTLTQLPNLTAFCQELENIIVNFPNLTEMDIGGLPSLKYSVFPLSSEIPCNLKSIKIENFSNLKHLFSGLVARTIFLQLEVLQIRSCESMEEVFWNEGIEDNTDGCIEFPKLKELRLAHLPNLTAFCQGLENNIIKLPSLTNVWIIGLPKLNSMFSLNSETLDDHTTSSLHFVCNPKDDSCCNLKYIYIWKCDKLRSLCSVSAARRCLLQLEDLKIESCESMEQVFWNEGTDDNTDGCIEFPKLKELRLKDLPNLTAFYQELENIIFNFPNLTEMDIGGLPSLKCSVFPLSSEIHCNLKSIKIEKFSNLKHLFTGSVARTILLQLEVLEIEDCESMEQVFWNEGTEENANGCIEFPKLKELKLQQLPNLAAFCQEVENIIFNFPNLTEMDIGGLPSLKYSVFPLSSEIPCNLKSIKIENFSNLKHLFSGSVARTILLQLEVLEIGSCESMEQVSWNEGTEENANGCIEFPKLKELTLSDLPNLTAFCQGLENNIIKFPNLTKMKIGGLPKMNSLCPLNSETLVVHDQNTSLHFVCNPKVEMDCLKELTFSNFQDNIRNIWCHQIPDNVFNNLEELSIHTSNGIRSLMSTSIAKNLVGLKWLTIHDCGELVEVIERDEDDDKQVADLNRLFPTLIRLKMSGLPKLKKFWQWNHGLELPLLKYVTINNCPIMETFTLGSINTPNIEALWVNDQQVKNKKDLNDVIRHIWTEGQDKSKVNGDGNGNENENKDESKDEYNNENVNKDDDSNEMN